MTPLMVSKLLLRSLMPGIADVGDGIVVWHTRPHPGWPAGEYRIVGEDEWAWFMASIQEKP